MMHAPLRRHMLEIAGNSVRNASKIAVFLIAIDESLSYATPDNRVRRFLLKYRQQHHAQGGFNLALFMSSFHFCH
jgi:hypothetical protein